MFAQKLLHTWEFLFVRDFSFNMTVAWAGITHSRHRFRSSGDSRISNSEVVLATSTVLKVLERIHQFPPMNHPFAVA